MAVSVDRTGLQSFTATNDDVNEPWSEVAADYSVSPPTITITMRWITQQGETWAQVDSAIAQLEE